MTTTNEALIAAALKAERSAADLNGYYEGGLGTRSDYTRAQENTDAVIADALAAIPAPTEAAVQEHCRQCRDELPYGSKLPAADFILWGKFFPREAFGPKCTKHARKWFDISQVDQYAVFDLRPLRQPAPKTQDGEAREGLIGTVRTALSDALLCGRVWEAWSYGTMTQDDFMQAADDSEFVSSLADAILARYTLVPVSPEGGE